MFRSLKWTAAFATLAGLATVFAPALWSVGHVQALTNVILGEFATLSMGYTTYRIAYGKDASRSVALASAVFGAVVAASPLVLGSAGGFAAVTIAGGAVVAVVGLAAFVTTFLAGDDHGVRNATGERDASDESAGAT